MRVTELRQLAPERFELGLSDGTSLRVGLNQIADFSLFAGRELAPEELEALREAAALQRTKERALRIIGQRAMSEGELYQRMTEKGETEQNAAAAVAWLIGLHLLSDADYAAMVARHYAAKGYGRRRVEQELYRRQVPKPLWEAALAELPEPELEALREAAALQRTKERAMRIIGQRAMSEGELYTRLTEKGETEQNAAAAVAWLVGLHLLSDEDYAALVVRHYAAKGYGRRRVEQELYRRQVPKALWEAALAELPEPGDSLDRQLQSRLRGADPGDRKALKRATDALLRRGYGWEEIRTTLERWREQEET